MTLFSLFSFSQLSSPLPSRSKMPSSPLVFSSDFEGSSSSDIFSVSSHSPSIRNQDFLPPQNTSSSVQFGARNSRRFFPSQTVYPSHPQLVHSNIPSLSIWFLISHQLQSPVQYDSYPFSMYDHMVPRANDPFEELSRMRDECNHWRTRYHELK